MLLLLLLLLLQCCFSFVGVENFYASSFSFIFLFLCTFCAPDNNNKQYQSLYTFMQPPTLSPPPLSPTPNSSKNINTNLHSYLFLSTDCFFFIFFFCCLFLHSHHHRRHHCCCCFLKRRSIFCSHSVFATSFPLHPHSNMGITVFGSIKRKKIFYFFI